MMEDDAVKQTYLCPDEHLAYIVSAKTGKPDYDMVFNKSHL